MRRRILIALLLACGTAQASDWGSLGKGADGKTEILVDRESILIQYDTRHAWMKMLFQPHTMHGEGKAKKKWMRETVTRVVFNCRDETSHMDALQVIYEDGSNETAPSLVLSAISEPVAPDTMLRVVMQFVCAWQPK